ncbi:L-threonylcarbamoyladenylate synthase [Granulicella sp. dw_53]|uniref:L-threonylcarbamoyladenylate synthase n=1 Tax=Granulicella sp. dw_53 TaxID=2719792 RepID=UPI001BD36541|nr:L-threonylcarbamoyladenylate synthase [Granulicella sp. dw_53]
MTALTTERLDATQPGSQAEEAVERAATILRGGGTVAFPTETVYGLAANALDAAAVAGIFAAKQRPSWDPLIVHVSDGAMLERVAVLTPRAEALIATFWPGPLTLLLPRTSIVPDAVTAGRPLVGVRMPSHPLALALLRAAGLPLAAPSANRFGHTSPTTAAHVLEDLDRRIDAVLDGGPTSVGLESTVLDPDGMVLYRPGAITPAMIEAVAGPVTLFKPAAVEAAPESLPSPGVGIRHYAPRARLILVADEVELRARITELAATEKLGVMLPAGWTIPSVGDVEVFPWESWQDASGLAHSLFSGLRELDSRAVTVILCPLPAAEGLGLAIRDRLEKAARAH